MNNQQQPLSFDWFELFELHGLLTCYGEPEGEPMQQLGVQLKDLVDSSEQFRVFRLQPTRPEQDAGVLLLTGEVLASLGERLEKRLGEEPYPDGEHPDHDLLDVLLPLQEKLRLCSNPETIYQIV